MARTGARLPSGPPPLHRPTGRMADPANGETVPRCRSCGMPDRAGNRVLVFGLVYAGKAVGTWTLCEADYLYVNGQDPRHADPLDVSQIA